MKDWAWVKGVAVTLMVFVLLIGLQLAGLSQVNARNASAQAEALRETVLRAMLTCYAVEGRYPPSIAYLQTNYGLAYDAKQYIVTMNAFADNLLPDISILTGGEG